MTIILRPYQQEALEAIYNSNQKTNLIMSAVGSGKTIIFSSLAANSKGRVLITVPSTELREQTIDKLKMINDNLNIGSVQADLDDVDAKIIVGTRQSLTHKKSTRLQRILNHGEIEYLIVDECHQAPEQIKKIINNLNDNIKILGFSATPYTKECIDIFGKPIFIKSIFDLIMDGYLCEPKAIQVFTKTDLNGVKTVGGEFVQKQLEDTVNNIERNKIIVEAYKKYASDRKSTLVFTSGISHSKELVKEFMNHGVYCKTIDSTLSDEERDNILNEFKTGKLPCLVNCMILTVGFDHPPVDCLILARPTKSRILYEQILGRGLRLFEGKENCLIIDIQDVIKNHDLMDISTIFNLQIKSGETVREAQQRIQKEIEEDEQRRIEEELRKQEAERKRQEQLELIAKQIKLFNRNFAEKFTEAYYHWWRVDAYTYAVSQDSDYHFAIEKIDENEFNVYKICTNKQKRNIELINTGTNILEVINYVEHYCFRRLTSFVYRDADWKKDKMTEKQRQYCKYGVTKWDAHKYFTSNTIKWLIKGWKKNNLEEKII